ncbi:MAG TPA: SBBP repeat-containing protein [Blastocatellia bacterium]|nr:SBBP repeat-containing protein [Blastocatellia bacterium]
MTKLSPEGNEIVFSTYLGGSGLDLGYGVASNGNAVFVTGATTSSDFPVKNPLQQTSGGGQDAFITKIDFTGSTLLYSTYFGGDGEDVGNGISVDAGNNVYIVGDTGSTNLPLMNPIQASFGGVVDGFVAKLATSISEQISLVYSTYLGGGGGDFGNDIVIDSNGNAYIAGATNSVNFPLVNPVQPAFGGGMDGFVAKLNASGSAFVFSTYLGGSGIEYAHGVAIDVPRNVYVAGETSSQNLPLVKPYQSDLRGVTDAFVMKLNSAGNTMLYSTYLGGADDDRAFAVAATDAGDAFVTGETFSTNFPTTSTGIQTATGGASDAFVSRLHVAVPTITAIEVKKKKLFVHGENFEEGAMIGVGGVLQKTKNDGDDPTTLLIAKKGAKNIKRGVPVGIHVENPDGIRSEQISYIKP